MARISKKSIMHLKEKVNIVEIIGEYVSLKKTGEHYVGLCPLHREKTPSFSVSPIGQFYHCFGCGESGDVYGFLMKREKLSFIEAVRKLSNIYGIPLDESHRGQSKQQLEIDKKSLEYNPRSRFRNDIVDILDATHTLYREELKTNTSIGAEKAREYLETRGISNSLVEKVGIGYSPSNDIFRFQLMDKFGWSNKKMTEILFRAGLINEDGFRAFSNRITLPIKNLEGKIIGFNSRSTNGNSNMKYKNTANRELFSKGHLLYGLEFIDDKEVGKEGLFLVEGQFDTFGFLEQGMQSCLGLGNSQLTSNNIEIIREMKPKKISLVTDGDIPSVISAVKNANNICDNFVAELDSISVIPTPEGKDPFDLFYSDKIRISDYASDKSLTVKEFVLSRELKDFETRSKSGLQNLKEISDSIFDTEEMEEIISQLLS